MGRRSIFVRRKNATPRSKPPRREWLRPSATSPWPVSPARRSPGRGPAGSRSRDSGVWNKVQSGNNTSESQSATTIVVRLGSVLPLTCENLFWGFDVSEMGLGSG
jgi:hypothetical protein